MYLLDMVRRPTLPGPALRLKARSGRRTCDTAGRALCPGRLIYVLLSYETVQHCSVPEALQTKPWQNASQKPEWRQQPQGGQYPTEREWGSVFASIRYRSACLLPSFLVGLKKSKNTAHPEGRLHLGGPDLRRCFQHPCVHVACLGKASS